MVMRDRERRPIKTSVSQYYFHNKIDDRVRRFGQTDDDLAPTPEDPATATSFTTGPANYDL